MTGHEDDRPAANGWRIVEEMRSQFAAFGESLEASRRELRSELAGLEERVNVRFDAVEAAVRQNSADIRQNSADIRQNSADIRENSRDIRALTDRVDRLEALGATSPGKSR